MVTIVGKDASIPKRKTCRNCSSILEYTPVEVIKQSYTDVSQCRCVHEYIVCPCCGVNVTIRDY